MEQLQLSWQHAGFSIVCAWVHTIPTDGKLWVVFSLHDFRPTYLSIPTCLIMLADSADDYTVWRLIFILTCVYSGNDVKSFPNITYRGAWIRCAFFVVVVFPKKIRKRKAFSKTSSFFENDHYNMNVATRLNYRCDIQVINYYKAEDFELVTTVLVYQEHVHKIHLWGKLQASLTPTEVWK